MNINAALVPLFFEEVPLGILLARQVRISPHMVEYSHAVPLKIELQRILTALAQILQRKHLHFFIRCNDGIRLSHVQLPLFQTILSLVHFRGHLLEIPVELKLTGMLFPALTKFALLPFQAVADCFCQYWVMFACEIRLF